MKTRGPTDRAEHRWASPPQRPRGRRASRLTRASSACLTLPARRCPEWQGGGSDTSVGDPRGPLPAPAARDPSEDLSPPQPPRDCAQDPASPASPSERPPMPHTSAPENPRSRRFCQRKQALQTKGTLLSETRAEGWAAGPLNAGAPAPGGRPALAPGRQQLWDVPPLCGSLSALVSPQGGGAVACRPLTPTHIVLARPVLLPVKPETCLEGAIRPAHGEG